VIVEDIEQRTYLYLIPRPLARYQQFLAKIAASASTTLVLVGASLVIFVGILLPLLWGQANAGESILKLVIALLLGTLAYTGLFAALASIFGRSILAGILYFILFEGMLSRLPVLELLSIRFHLYKLLEYVPEEAATDMFLPRALEVTPTMSGVSLGVAAAVFIGVGLLVSEYKEYK